MLKSKTEIEIENAAINNSSYFTIKGENMEAARTTAKVKLVRDLWIYIKDRPVYPGRQNIGTYGEYSEELWKGIEKSINSFKLGAGGTFLHYFNSYCKRFLKKEIYRAYENRNNIYLVPGDVDMKQEGKGISLFDTLESDMPTPEAALNKKEEQKEKQKEEQQRVIVVLEAMDFVFTQKTVDTQKPLLKQVLTLEYAKAIPPDASYFFIDHDLLSRLKAGEKFTRSKIATAFYPERTNAGAKAKVGLERFLKKVRKYIAENKKIHKS